MLITRISVNWGDRGGHPAKIQKIGKRHLLLDFDHVTSPFHRYPIKVIMLQYGGHWALCIFVIKSVAISSPVTYDYLILFSEILLVWYMAGDIQSVY